MSGHKPDAGNAPVAAPPAHDLRLENEKMLPMKQRVDAIIRDSLSPLLKEAGFKKSGRVFRSCQEDHVRIVSVHSSGRDIDGLGTIGLYGVELGVFFPGVRAVEGKAEVSKPRIHDCQVFSGVPADGWGSFDDPAGNCPDVTAQARALGEQWALHVPDWFEQYSRPEAALEWAIKTENWKEALYLAIFLKDMDRASQCLEMCRQMYGGEWGIYLEEIATRHGVPGAETSNGI